MMEEDVKEELKENTIKAIKVTRRIPIIKTERRSSQKRPIAMVIAQPEKKQEYKKIYEL